MSPVTITWWDWSRSPAARRREKVASYLATSYDDLVLPPPDSGRYTPGDGSLTQAGQADESSGDDAAECIGADCVVSSESGSGVTCLRPGAGTFCGINRRLHSSEPLQRKPYLSCPERFT